MQQSGKRAWTAAATGQFQCEENGARQVMESAAIFAAHEVLL
jgi:hypothetical protein